MNRVIEWFVHNSVTANLLMLFVIISGAASLLQLKQEVFPEFSSDIISVSVPYPGATPEEVEEGISVRIEEAVQDLEGIDKLSSTSTENAATVTIEVKAGYDTRKILDDVKSRVDGISTFPDEAEKPIVQEFLQRRQVINVAISGDTDEHTLKSLGEAIRDELSDIDGISQVDLTATRDYEVSIEVSEEALRQYSLTFDEVVQAVRRSSLDLPGGSLETSAGEILLRSKGQAYRGREFEDIILRSSNDGVRLRLGDVAKVVDGFADTDLTSRFNNKPGVLVKVFRVGNESALDIAGKVKSFVAAKQQALPPGIELTTWQDDSKVLKDRISLLLKNGFSGFVLVFIALALFLRLKLAIWVVVGMLISFFGAFWVMPFYSVSINLLSLFAFILVLGIVVDDAIVVGENIYTHVESGKSGLQAAIDGTKEVAVPVIFAVLTTVAAFSPLLNVTGNTGKFMKVIPIIVIATLLFSLVESLLVLPSHLSHLKHESEEESRGGITGTWRRFQNRFAGYMQRFVIERYQPSLETALRWRGHILLAAIAVLILSISVVRFGWIKFTFMPDVEADNVVALVSMPQGTPMEATAAVVNRLEKAARQMQQEYSAGDNNAIQYMLATAGSQPYLSNRPGPNSNKTTIGGAHLGEINLQLYPAEERTVTSPEIARRWRELAGVIPDVEQLSFVSSLFNSGDPINFELAGSDYNALAEAADALKLRIAEYPGTFDIRDSFQDGKKEIKLKLKPEAEALGLTQLDLARQIRQAFFGEEAQRIQRGRDEVKVMVRYPEEARKSLADLEGLRLRLPAGGQIPFQVAAEVTAGRGFSAISRTDRKRTISVTSDVDISQANATEIVAAIKKDVMPELQERYPSISYKLEGEQAEQAETLTSLLLGFGLALILIYILLAIPFGSYIQPLIVMSAIPFGLVGAILGHLLLGMNLTILSIFGIVALAGVVVNDSLVMVDFINRARKGGLPIDQAIRQAGMQRFRPILLTSVTTFAGLTPLLLERSLQAQFLIPMATSLAFGVLFATTITLILVPCLYLLIEDAKAAFLRIWASLSGKEAKTHQIPT